MDFETSGQRHGPTNNPWKDTADDAMIVQKSSTNTATGVVASAQQPHPHRLQQRGISIAFLLLALYMIEQATGAQVFIIIQQHEPSIRIFRCLLEVFLLLVGTAVSIHVYCHYLGADHVKRLLFTIPPFSSEPANDIINDNSNHGKYQRGGATEEEEEDEESSVEIQFQDYDENGDAFDNDDQEQDIVEYIGDIHHHHHHESKCRPGDEDDNNANQSTTREGAVAANEQERPPPPPFVSSSSSLSSNDRIPSPASLLGAALDLLLYILVTLVLYTVAAIGAADETLLLVDIVNDEQQRRPYNKLLLFGGYQNWWAALSSLAAPTFPLILFLFCLGKAIWPWRRRRTLWRILSFTIYAPWHEVTFRDGLIGDILTSTVRPLQDVAFTICYILFGLNQWWYLQQQQHNNNNGATQPAADHAAASIYDNDETNNAAVTATITSNFVDAADANVPAMEKSWMLHTLILPACAISPLWYRFLQTMRQTHDHRRRWPYLGNAAKYFVAAQVAMFGVYHPEVKHSSIWLMCFVLATLYQIWWDLIMDWGLFVKKKTKNRQGGRGGDNGSFPWELRHNRLYPSTRFYWSMVVINTLLRFCWTLSFIPFSYLSGSTGVLTTTFSSRSWANVLGPLIASAEIIRRTLWGLLRVEWEIVKHMDDVDSESFDAKDDPDDEKRSGGVVVEMTPMHVSSSVSDGAGGRAANGPLFSDMSGMDSTQLLVELSIYTSTFAVLGLLIAAHRETL